MDLQGARRRQAVPAVLVLATVWLGPGLGARQPADPPALTQLRAYLDAYEPRLGELIADERFDQRYQAGIDSERHLLVSEVGFLRLPGDLEWIGQRSVVSVNGRPLRRSAGSLAEQLTGPTDMARALAIAAENARFNLGRPRSINVPTLPLDLLNRRSATALQVTGTGRRRFAGQSADTISLREPGAGALVASGPGRFARATIEAAVDPASGALLTARVDLRLSEPDTTHRIEVDFGHDASLGLLVPTTLRETFLGVRGTATYSNFRRFRTSARIVP